MNVEDFDYKFPSSLIAKRPPKIRGQSRLLVLNRANGSLQHKRYEDLLDYVSPGDLVVLNDTKVIKARLLATNSSGQQREFLLLEKHKNDNDWRTHQALYRGQITPKERLKIANAEILIQRLEPGGIAELRSTTDLLELADRLGNVPLPPYMKREATKADIERYQTVFAHQPGSVAAPTASLNFTKTLQQKLQAKGAKIAYLTLHVGLGTFLPIRTNELEKHHMHSEYFEIPKITVRAIQDAKQKHKKVLAVGTTVARTLEYAADDILLGSAALSGEADIFIYPGYEFKLVDHLLTNFHAPKSTVLMLTAAFAGWDNLQNAYNEAVKQKYALLSYGDSMLIT